MPLRDRGGPFPSASRQVGLEEVGERKRGMGDNAQ